MMRAVVAVALLCLSYQAMTAEAVSRKLQRSKKASAGSLWNYPNCDCSWASANTCGSNDGSACFQWCCLQGAACTAINGLCGRTSTCAQYRGSVVKGKCPGSGDNVCCVQGGAAPAPVQPQPPRPVQPTPTPVQPSPPSQSNGVDTTLTQSGITTRYWDCCKPSCAWSSNTFGRSPVKTCAQNGVNRVSGDTNNVCAGGGSGGAAYTCNDNQPFTQNGMAYGFVATQIGQCCDCFMLQFKNTNKKMIVQRTNTGGDLSQNQFDIQMPGGGFGIFNGCSNNGQNGPAQWGGGYSWGAQYGGVSSRSQCASLPAALQNGCYFRFDYVGDNPQVRFKQVACPAQLTAITGCA